MKLQDITSGFQHVDGSQTAFLVKFLEELNRHPVVQGNFREQLNWLNIKPGDRVLDIGCGIGDQALEMAKQAGVTGEVVGTDISETMIEVAKQRHMMGRK
jgi:2-polyprenyl-3-methyl-5-hydroxy-6-metoxy-1,4-benzoquinol methylase